MSTQLNLIERAEEIECETSEAAIWKYFEQTVAKVGIDFYIYLTVTEDKKRPHIATNTQLHEDTVSQVFDPFLDYCCNSYAVNKTGVEFLVDYPYLDDASKGFIQDAASFGFRSGLGIPMRLQGSKRYGGFNLGTRFTREDFEELVFPLADSLRLFCLIVHRRVEELRVDASNSAKLGFRSRLISPPVKKLEVLSPREREVLFLVSKGFSRKRCAEMCEITEHTVSTHLKNSYEKLGVHNKAQATRVVVEAGFSL